jgi:hypothetical protein
VDFSTTSGFSLSSDGVRILVQKAAAMDVQGVKTKLAIIVSIPVAYGLGRMYEMYRSLVPNNSKEVRVFKNYRDALEWINNTDKPDRVR